LPGLGGCQRRRGAIVNARVESRLRRDGGALIATLTAALDGDHDFMDGRLCALRYLLQFTSADGTVESIGYL